MKYLKMLGFAAVAAAALMAFVGAGSASAAETSLCSTNTNPCSGTKYGSGTVIKSSLKTGTVATLTNPLGNVTCSVSTVTGKTTAASGTPLPGEVTGLTFETCVRDKALGGTEACEVKVEGLPYKSSITTTEKASNGNGILTVENPKALVVCGTVINCTFSAATVKLHVTGGAPATAIASEQVLNREGGLCPSEAKWDAEYTVSEPNPLFVI